MADPTTPAPPATPAPPDTPKKAAPKVKQVRLREGSRLRPVYFDEQTHFRVTGEWQDIKPGDISRATRQHTADIEFREV